MNEIDYLTAYYGNYNEDARLSPKHGQVEFMTTMRYIKKFLKPDMVGLSHHSLDVFRKI